MAYAYDPVGSLREMTDTVIGLDDVPQTATWNWTYDDRYRLLSESVDDASSFVARTEYDWDDAGNRLTKREYSGAVLDRTITYSTPNNLNQMLGWDDGTTNAVYSFDANGARTNATLIAGTSTNTTSYSCDEDNRLVGVALNSPSNTHSFAYDYRTRRYYRATPAETNLCVFDGGLSVQEYDASQSTVPQASSLQVEYLRGPNLGGGVGGMVYSIRSDGIRCSHANHRGDVVMRTGPAGQLTWFARYEAYGTRFTESGQNPDRQMANTKDEEKGINLLFEGMRPRHLLDGVMLSRDPAGFIDGLNLYAYVRQNPVNAFDKKGLNTNVITDGGNSYSTADYVSYVNLEVSVIGLAAEASAWTGAQAYDIAAPHPIDDMGLAVDLVQEGGFKNVALATLLTVGVVSDVLDVVSPGVDAIDVAQKGVREGAKGALGKGARETAEAAVETITEGSTSGTKVFRQGTFPDETMGWQGNKVKGTEWAAENPLTTPDYAKKYGLPAENTGKPDWVAGGTTTEPYTTRPAPPSHNNPLNTGGGTEILPDNPDSGVSLDWFSMPED